LKSKTGFTLLELIIVTIIIGILAAIGGPMYFKTIERARMAEGRIMLGMIRMAQMRYYAEHITFTNNIKELDIDTVNGKFFDLVLMVSANGLRPGDGLGCGGYVGEVRRNDVQNPYGSNYRLRVLPNGDVCHEAGNWPNALGDLLPVCV